MRTIVRLELSRTRSVYRHRLLLWMVLAMLLILGLFFVVLKTGGFYQNVFYTYASNDVQLSGVLSQNPRFLADAASPDLYLTGGSAPAMLPRGFAGSAAEASAYSYFKLYNYEVWQRFNESSVLLLRIVVQNQTPANASGGRLVNTYVGTGLQNATAGSGAPRQGAATNGSVPPPVPAAGPSAPAQPASSPAPGGVQVSREALALPKAQVPLFPSANATPEGNASADFPLTARDLEPRMPFDQIYLSMSFIVALTFLALIFSNRIMDEKVNRKGILLFVAPVSKRSIVVGKFLPYFTVGVLLSALLILTHLPPFASFVMALLLMATIVLVYLALSFVIGVVARSFKELSFLGVFAISLYSLFLLIPVFLLHFSDASIASPLTPVIQIMLGTSVPFATFLFSLLPHLLFAGVLLVIGYVLFNAEDFFSFSRIPQKLAAYFARILKGSRGYFFAGFSAVFFVYLAELMLIMVAVTVPRQAVLLVILAASAVTEELFRNAPLLVMQLRHLVRSPKTAYGNALLVGIGFFAAEKLLLLISIAPFASTLHLLQFSSLLIPLVLHMLLSVLFLFLLRRTRMPWLAFLVTSLLHFLADYLLLSGVIV